MPKRSSTGRLDLNQLAKRIVDQATGEATKTKPPPIKKSAATEIFGPTTQKTTTRQHRR